MKQKKILIYVGIVIITLLPLAGYSASHEHTATIAFGGDTLFGGYYSTSPRTAPWMTLRR